MSWLAAISRVFPNSRTFRLSEPHRAVFTVYQRSLRFTRVYFLSSGRCLSNFPLGFWASCASKSKQITHESGHRQLVRRLFVATRQYIYILTMEVAVQVVCY